MKNFTFLIITILIAFSTNLKGQKNHNSNIIQVIPLSGKYVYEYNDTILGNDKQLAYFLLNSKKENVIKLAKRFKRRSTLAEVFLGIGGGFAVIWAINESGNTEFHSTVPVERLWYNIVVITTISTSSVGAFIHLSAKKQLKLGIEEFNKKVG